MTPLVIGLATVVMVILIAVAIGMRYVRNEERADLADREGERGAAGRDRSGTRGRPDPELRRAGQRPGPRRPAARPADGARQRRADARGDNERSGRGPDRGSVEADRGRDDRPHDGSARVPRSHGDRRDEQARPQQRQEARSPARARQARGRRSDDGDWPRTEWDRLSDADYWKEVASDRPLVTTVRTAQPAQPSRPAPLSQGRNAAIDAGHVPSGGHGAQRGQEPPGGQEASRETAWRPERGALEPAANGSGGDFLTAPTHVRYAEPARPWPVRPEAARLEPARPEPARLELVRPDSASREPARPDPGRREPSRPEPMRPEPSRPWLASAAGTQNGQRASGPMRSDDDPLTSPSFPKIVTSDSRSYRNGRPSTPGGRPADQDAYGAPTEQFASPSPAGCRAANGGAVDRYGRGFDGSGSAATAPYSYRPDSYRPAVQPAAGSYPANNHQPTGHAAGVGSAFAAGQQQPPASPPASPPSAVSPPAGNPYGSYVSTDPYVSTDLPGFPDNPASAYPQGQAAHGYQDYSAGPANGHAAPAYSYEVPLSNSEPPQVWSSSWYPDVPSAIAPGTPAGDAPGSYAGGRHDVSGYTHGEYGAQPDAAGYPPADGHFNGQPDAAGYLPPESYGGDGYGGQRRR